MQRGHNFAIVDEVDSILIDEARTPLIISGQGEQSTELYNVADRFAKTLRPIRVAETNEKEDSDEIYEDYDYIINEKQKTATLTKRGVKKAEQFFSLEKPHGPGQHHHSAPHQSGDQGKRHHAARYRLRRARRRSHHR
mgnify:FL=1